ncbi:hypothetical protein C8Q76DRAFT_695452 [Earliella scabrosa]|nr:hypothetical protein C8Q76DRAFT_695452 [Earliella scabrosa]
MPGYLLFNGTTLVPVGIMTPDWGANSSPESIKATWLGSGRRECCLCVAEVCQNTSQKSMRSSSYTATVTLWTSQRSAPSTHFTARTSSRRSGTRTTCPRMHILDWWVTVAHPSASAAIETGAGTAPVKGSTRPTAARSIGPTRCGHRGLLRRSSLPKRALRKVYFGGDTGYQMVFDGEDEDAVARGPAFREVGDRFGGFDSELLLIEAYAPCAMWSGLHASPGDPVEVFNDLGARRALGMHGRSMS